MYRSKDSPHHYDKHAQSVTYGGGSDPVPLRMLELPVGHHFGYEVTQPEAVLVCDGTLYVISDGQQKHNVGAGKMFFLPPGVRVTVGAVEDSSAMVLGLDLSQRHYLLPELAQLAQFKESVGQAFNPVPFRPCIRTFIDGTAPLLESGLADSLPFLSAKVTEFVHIFLNFYPREEQAAFFFPLLGADLDFNRFVTTLVDKVGSVGEMARLIHMSRAGFIHKFRRKMGVSPAEYLKKCRVESIRGDLVNTSIPLKEVAARHGFDHYEVFSRFCSRNLGDAPSKIRKRRR